MKTKSYDFKAFMKGEHEKQKKTPTTSLIPLAIAPFIPTTAFAEESDAKVMEAFSPIIDLIQSMAYPVAMICVLGGGIFVMIGSQDKGYSMISRAALGYCLVMLLPMFMDILVDAMRSVS